MEKRKRAPGGGRRPGRFGRLDVVMSLRLPAKMMKKLKRAAEVSDHTLSEEVLGRLNDSLEDERSELIQRAIREIGFSVEELSALLDRMGWKSTRKPKRRK